MKIGHLDWEVVVVASREVLGSGRRDILLDEVEIERRAGTRGQKRQTEIIRKIAEEYPRAEYREEPDSSNFRKAMAMELLAAREELGDAWNEEEGLPHFVKRIKLGDVFWFGLAETPESKVGFGMIAGRTDAPTFSWEWFNVEANGVAEKLQEVGRLSLKIKETANFEEIVYTHFETDISLRLTPSTCDAPNAEGEKIDRRRHPWRINIKRGAEIFWPSLVKGKVVSNGNL